MMFQSQYVRHLYSGFEPSQVFDVVYGSTFEHRLLSSKLAKMEHQRLFLGDLLLETGWYNFPLVGQGSMPPNAICIGFLAQGGEITRLNTASIGPDDIQVYPCGAELLYHASGASRWVAFIVPEDRLQATALERMGRPLEMPQHVSHSIRLRKGGIRTLTCLTDDALQLAQRLDPTGGLDSELAQEIYQSLLAGYVDALSEACALRKSERHSTDKRHYQLISACERLVLSGSGIDVPMSEIAKRSGYSLRSLELIFRRGVGMSPGRWFMTARLNGALRDLLTCEEDTTVSEIAMKWGFRHMSRFAQYYKEAFGESPSETIKRPRTHAR